MFLYRKILHCSDVVVVVLPCDGSIAAPPTYRYPHHPISAVCVHEQTHRLYWVLPDVIQCFYVICHCVLVTCTRDSVGSFTLMYCLRSCRNANLVWRHPILSCVWGWEPCDCSEDIQLNKFFLRESISLRVNNGGGQRKKEFYWNALRSWGLHSGYKFFHIAVF